LPTGTRVALRITVGCVMSTNRVWYSSLAIAVALLLHAAPARAAAPVCDGGPFLYALPAGLTHVEPRAPCTDADGDAITVDVSVAPHLGTLSPAGAMPIDTVRFYTANADAASVTNPRDTMTFVATAGGEQSTPMRVDVKILPPDNAPVCTDVAVTVASGHSVHIPTSQCTDADGGIPTVVFDKPAHGTFDATTGRYRPKPGFTGKDTMTFAAVDYWKVSSKVGTVTIKVTKGSGGGGGGGGGGSATADHRAPKLVITVPPRLDLAGALADGIPFTVQTNEEGRLAVNVYVSRRTARHFGLKKDPHKRFRIGRVVSHLTPGKTVVTAKLSSRAQSHLAGARRVRLTLVAKVSDAAGNVRTKHARLVLRHS
jgi:Big-like domain-containing protein